MTPQLEEVFKSLKDHFSEPTAEIDKTILDILFREKVFKCFLPVELNGLGLSLLETMEVIRESAFINGSLGWLVQIGNGGNYFASCFPEQIAKELFTPLSAVIAGSGAPSGSAVKLSDGYLLNGTWRYCSGADYAGLFTVTFICPESGERLAAILTKGHVEVIRDWRTAGLPQTSTHSIRLNQVKVDKSHIFDVCTQVSYLDNSVFQMPFIIYAQSFFLQVVLGLGSKFLHESTRFLEHKNQHWATVFPERIDSCRNKLHQLEAQTEHLKNRVDEMTLAYVEATSDSTSEEKNRLELAFLTKKLRERVHSIFWDLGIEVVYKDHPIHQVYQDFIVCTQHYLLREY